MADRDSVVHQRFQSRPVDVNHFEQFHDAVHRHRPIERPNDDFEIVPALFHPVEDAIEEQVAVEDQLINLAEFVFGEFFPALLTFHMFEAFVPTEREPVFAKPVLQGRITEIVAFFLAFDPLMAEGFLPAFVPNTADRLVVTRDHPVEVTRLIGQFAAKTNAGQTESKG